MNLLLVDAEELAGGTELVVRGRRAEHIANVLRAAPGDTVRIGVVRGRTGTARVIAVDAAQVVLAATLHGPPPSPPAVDVVLAVPRPKVMSRVLQTVAAFGVGRIDLVNAWRVDKAYFESRRLAPDAIERDLRLGCEQGATTWVPSWDVHRLLMRFFDRVDGVWPDARRIVAHPHASARIEDVLADDRRTVVAVGPEGGWIDRELESLSGLGFVPVSMGPRVLRTEAAVAALLAQLSLLSRLGARSAT